MAEFVFTSPGVKFRERDLTYVTRNIGVTTLGLVGETEKGPAFEPVYVEDSGQFRDRFGNQSIDRLPNGKLKYELPYVANSYLDESNQLWVTRVLGLSGYDAGKAWAITLSAGVDPSTTGYTSTVVTGYSTFTGGSYLGVTLNAVGDTGNFFSGFNKTSNTDFTGQTEMFTATTYNNTVNSGETYYERYTVTATSLNEYENMVLAVIRSRADIDNEVNLPQSTHFYADELTILNNKTLLNNGDLFAEFMLKASLTTDPDDVPEEFVVSLNPNSSSFLPNVLGSSAKDKKNKIWVEAIYPQLLRKLDGNELGYGINTTLIEATTEAFSNYKTQFQTPETPWIVSQLNGNVVHRLFKFISISDGDSANREIKVTIGNIDLESLEFDVFIRDFYDTDASPIILETFTRCNMVKGTNGFIGQRIGTIDGEYDLLSKYIMIELAENFPVQSFPAGFEGYMLNNYSSTTTNASYDAIPPQIMYKTAYNDNERVNKVYLGISASAYDSSGSTSTGINQNLFNFNGWRNDGNNNPDNFVKSKGFHMDSGVTDIYYDGGEYIGEFEVGKGKFQTIYDVVNPTDPYYDKNTRKFTLVPAGGFDGWDVNRNYRTYGDNFRPNGIYDGVDTNVPPVTDFQAWTTAINTFANPEEITINLFATPGINWSDNNILVKDTIDMIEQKRTDTLYIIDTPDINIKRTIGDNKVDVVASEDIVDLLTVADVDTSYGATYFPYIQIRDTFNNVNVYIPPTGEIVKSIAFTDNTKFPWFAPAGLQRGVTDAKKSKYKLSPDARDILYKGRINPLADYANVGTAIMGQKTLQVKESALNRINVRRLLLQVKVLIANIATRLVFEQNDQATIDQFLAKATPVLDSIKRERGLYDFRVKMDDSNNTPETRDRNELYGEIFLKPTRSVEFIGITFTITPSGASFDDLGA